MNGLEAGVDLPDSDIAVRGAGRKPRGGFRWVVLLVIFLAYLVAGADRANIGIVAPFLKSDFKLTNADIGATVTLFYIGYGLVQIPSGLLYERFGIRWIMALSMVLTSASTIFVGVAGSGAQLLWSRVILGVAEGPIIGGILTIINRWFPAHEKGTAVGVYMSSIKLAPALVPPLGALIISQLGWRDVFLIFGVPGVFIAAAWLFLVADGPRASRFCQATEADYIDGGASRSGRAKADPVRLAWTPRPWLDALIRVRRVTPLERTSEILLSPNLLGCSVGYGLMAGITYGIMTWVPTYLIQVKHFPLAQTGIVAATPWLGAILGNMLGGIVSDRLLEKRRKPLMLFTTASSIVMMYALIYAPAAPLALSVLLIATGILLNVGYSTFLVYPMALVAQHRLPFASSILVTIGSVGGAFVPYAIGVILDNYSWDAVFLFMAACSLAALAITLLLIEPVPTAPVMVTGEGAEAGPA